MPYSSNTLNRRYELPTCLLEVWTERSPLSDWQSQIVAQNLRFRLQLAHRAIKGNQQQIINLIEAVTIYCDRWLAQDEFDTLDHAIAVPQLSKLKLSTLQLFDLYESLELCANELVILPNVVLEVRHLSPNWLKLMASAIAIIGISIGTIRLISREQPSYQIASSPTIASSEKASKQPAAIADSKAGSSSQAIPIDPEAKSNVIIPPLPNQNQANQNQANQNQVDKIAIAPEPAKPESIDKPTGYSNRDRAIDKLPTAIDKLPTINPVAISGSPKPSQSSRLEVPNQSPNQSPNQFPNKNADQAESSSATPSAKVAAPSSRAATANNEINIKVLQIQSELPSDITTSLVDYIQSQRINLSDKPSATPSGTIALDLEISGDRLRNILVDTQSSSLSDRNAIAELTEIILKWRSANSATGKIRLVLQF